ncbi:hypothetical protein [Paraferrimonas sp. SM1919]|uniref:hypothetical protein n=1 Tax=Paraferrimonas sp. SM1919 TaxID=2662263 RepID=UPI0013D82D3F|nr:hypothetical protein [Paraferrimonas sp. SM1919]
MERYQVKRVLMQSMENLGWNAQHLARAILSQKSTEIDVVELEALESQIRKDIHWFTTKPVVFERYLSQLKAHDEYKIWLKKQELLKQTAVEDSKVQMA